MIDEDVDEHNASVYLMSDIVHIAQRASPDTCFIAARTIARQALKFLKTYPEKIRNIQRFQNTSRELCECLLTLRVEIAGTGEEILIKRDALDLLLLISAELIYPVICVESPHVDQEIDNLQYA